MLLSEIIYESLESKNLSLNGIIADWLEDNKSYIPEVSMYVTRLRSKSVSVRTLIDIVTKFGERKERRLFAKWDRICLDLRKKRTFSSLGEQDFLTLKSRRKINTRINSIPRRHGGIKRFTMINITKRIFLPSANHWYMVAIKNLLGSYYNNKSKREENAKP